MFRAVYDCCQSCAKKLAKGVLDDEERDGRAVDAAIYIMGRYRSEAGFYVKKLEYMCKMTVHSYMHRKSQQRRDKSVVYDSEKLANKGGAVTDMLEEIENRRLQEILATPAYEKGGFDELSKCVQLELF